jgi:hypothetical protein
MTPEEEARIRELPKLIANENDPAKMKVLAIELTRLLTMRLKLKVNVPAQKKPRSS